MRKNQLLTAAKNRYIHYVKQIDWLYKRLDELKIKKPGDTFTMDDKIFTKGTIYVCLEIRYRLDDLDIMYGVKQKDSDVYDEMNYLSMRINDKRPKCKK